MKVICIENKYSYGVTVDTYSDITIGKVYDVLKTHGRYYTISDNNGVWLMYPIVLFKTLDEYRMEQLNTLFDE